MFSSSPVNKTLVPIQRRRHICKRESFPCKVLRANKGAKLWEKCLPDIHLSFSCGGIWQPNVCSEHAPAALWKSSPRSSLIPCLVNTLSSRTAASHPSRFPSSVGDTETEPPARRGMWAKNYMQVSSDYHLKPLIFHNKKGTKQKWASGTSCEGPKCFQPIIAQNC